MFYAHFVLSKKGPLAKIWLAAHWDKKLTKAHVFETNIDSSVEAIIEPKVKMALRTSGHLLLGVVRIYSRKAKYLLADCNEAFVKIKMAFRPGVVDMPEENREAAVATITLPETFHDFDTTMADLSDIDVQAQFSVNQSRPEEITMREDLGNITLVGDDGFGDMGFDDRNLMQDDTMDDSLYKADGNNLLLDDPLAKQGTEKPLDIDFDATAAEGNFGKNDFDDFGPAGVDDDDDSDNDAGFGGDVDDDLFNDNFMGEAGGLFEEPPTAPVPTEPTLPEPPQPDELPEGIASETMPPPRPLEETVPIPDQTTMSSVRDQTTLVPNEAEAFALEPLDITTLGTERKTKRKRKLVVDESKGIASETMKLQLADTSEITSTLDLAPPTKKLMHWKETGGVEKLFALPGRPITSKRISKAFNHNLITKPVRDADDDEDKLELMDPHVEEHEVRREDVAPFEPPHLEPPPMLDDQPPIARQSLDQSALSTRSSTANFSRQEESLLPPQDVSLPHPDVSLPHPDISLPHPDVSLPAPDLTLPAPDVSLPPPPPRSESDMDEEDNEPLPSPDSLPPHGEAETDDMFMNALPAEEDEEGTEDEGNEEDEEEKEERRWGKRSQQLLYMITKNFRGPREETSFKAMCRQNYRKQVASKFYTLLVLKKQQAICVEQPEPFADITISKGPCFKAVG